MKSNPPLQTIVLRLATLVCLASAVSTLNATKFGLGDLIKVNVDDKKGVSVKVSPKGPSKGLGHSNTPTDLSPVQPQATVQSTGLPPAESSAGVAGRDKIEVWNPHEAAVRRASSVPLYPVMEAIPQFTIEPLTKVQSIYNAVKDDDLSRNSFCISADGAHCASFQRKGLTAWAVEIDGKCGPEFAAVCKPHLYPNDDYSEVLYVTRSGAEEVLAIQSQNGSVKQFVATARTTSPEHPSFKSVAEVRAYEAAQAKAEAADSASWRVNLEASLENRRLVRYRQIDIEPLGPATELQVDEDGPVMGPIHENIKLVFDKKHKHYLLPTQLAAGDKHELGLEPALFIDGVRACRELLPPPVHMFPGDLSAEFIDSDGSFLARLVWNRTTTEILNGKKVADHQGSGGALPISRMAYSPDSQHIAGVYVLGGKKVLLLDGSVVFMTLPENVEIGNLQFTGDSRGVVYSVRSSGYSSVFADGKEILTLNRARVEALWAGPHLGEFACFSDKQDLIVNGKTVMAARADGREKFTCPPRLWFTSDGQHVFGYGNKRLEINDGTMSGKSFTACVFIADGLISVPEVQSKPFYFRCESPSFTGPAFDASNQWQSAFQQADPKNGERHFYALRMVCAQVK